MDMASIMQMIGGLSIWHFTVMQWVGFITSIIGSVACILKVLVQMGVPLQSEVGWVDKIMAFLSTIAMHPSAAMARRPGLPALTKAVAAAKAAGKTVAFLLLTSTLFVSTHALASPVVVSMGPSIPLLRVGLGDGPNGQAEVSMLKAGAGYSIVENFIPFTINGTEWSALDLAETSFLTAAGPNGNVAFSEALSLGTMNNLIGIGFGADLVNSTGSDGQASGLLVGKVNKFNLFTVLVFSINFDFSGPTTGGAAGGAAPASRGATIHW